MDTVTWWMGNGAVVQTALHAKIGLVLAEPVLGRGDGTLIGIWMEEIVTVSMAYGLEPLIYNRLFDRVC